MAEITNPERIELGQRAVDRVTGFEGICIARTEWISGCTRVTLQPKVGDDGKVPESVTFDEPMLMLIGPGIDAKPSGAGGPGPEPRRAPGPSR